MKRYNLLAWVKQFWASPKNRHYTRALIRALTNMAAVALVTSYGNNLPLAMILVVAVPLGVISGLLQVVSMTERYNDIMLGDWLVKALAKRIPDFADQEESTGVYCNWQAEFLAQLERLAKFFPVEVVYSYIYQGLKSAVGIPPGTDFIWWRTVPEAALMATGSQGWFEITTNNLRAARIRSAGKDKAAKEKAEDAKGWALLFGSVVSVTCMSLSLSLGKDVGNVCFGILFLLGCLVQLRVWRMSGPASNCGGKKQKPQEQKDSGDQEEAPEQESMETADTSSMSDKYPYVVPNSNMSEERKDKILKLARKVQKWINDNP